jgi:hypothetical protein
VWLDVARDQRVYEELTRVIVNRRFEMRTRLGYLYSLGDDGSAKVGGMFEHFVLPGRPGNVLRVGPILLLAISSYLEGLATFTGVVVSPDDLGPNHGSYGYLGLRGRLAHRF